MYIFDYIDRHSGVSSLPGATTDHLLHTIDYIRRGGDRVDCGAYSSGIEMDTNGCNRRPEMVVVAGSGRLVHASGTIAVRPERESASDGRA